MTERLPDWDLFIAVAGEAHGAVEGLWHGIDPSHPLHGHPSAGRPPRPCSRSIAASIAWWAS